MSKVIAREDMSKRPNLGGLYAAIRSDSKKGLNSYLLGIAEALLLGYSIGSGKHLGLRPDRWRGDLKAAYKALLAGSNASAELSEAFRYPLGQEPIKTLAGLVKEQHDEWTQAEARKHLLALAAKSTPEQLAQAIKLLEGTSNEQGKARQQLPANVGISGRQASPVSQSNGSAVQQAGTVANVSRTGQVPGSHGSSNREQHRAANQTQAAGSQKPR